MGDPSTKLPQDLLEGVESFPSDSLKHTKTREPASGADLMSTEIAIKSSLKEVEEFKKDSLKNITVQEKNPLPDSEAIRMEAEHSRFKDGIEKFDKEKLSHTETVEKNTLPSADDIRKEKSA